MSETNNPELNDEEQIDWDAPDEFEEDINDISIGIDQAVETEDLGRIALLGLEALALESWHDMYTFESYAEACRETWDKALTAYDNIVAARQQG